MIRDGPHDRRDLFELEAIVDEDRFGEERTRLSVALARDDVADVVQVRGDRSDLAAARVVTQ